MTPTLPVTISIPLLLRLLGPLLPALVLVLVPLLPLRLQSTALVSLPSYDTYMTYISGTVLAYLKSYPRPDFEARRYPLSAASLALCARHLPNNLCSRWVVGMPQCSS